mmetsp:Transcript_34210/g.100700  ORF Transcript_34210/g.100700 Transcript_34210/m.100700 type:complete len:251 (+) Transcript_34210:169-921(+)
MYLVCRDDLELGIPTPFVRFYSKAHTLKERGQMGGVLGQSAGLEDHGSIQSDDEEAGGDVGPEAILDDLGDFALAVGGDPLVDGPHGLALGGEVGGTPPGSEGREDVEHHGDVGGGDAEAAVAGDGQAGAGEHGQGQAGEDQGHVEEGDLVEVEHEDGGVAVLHAQPLQGGRHDDAAAEEHAAEHVSREEDALGDVGHEGRPRAEPVVGKDEAGQAGHPYAEAGQFHHLGIELPVLLLANVDADLLQGLE